MYNEQKANGAFRAGSTIDATDAITQGLQIKEGPHL